MAENKRKAESEVLRDQKTPRLLPVRLFKSAKAPPKSGKIPILKMILRYGPGEKQVQRIRTLLDPGASIPVIDNTLARDLGIHLHEHESGGRRIESFNGEMVKEAGKFYTDHLLLQHHQHVSKEQFEVVPTGADFDIILPFWWICKHRPTGFIESRWDAERVRFNSDGCKNCTLAKCISNYPISWDESILTDPSAGTIAYVVYGTLTPEQEKEALDKVPPPFRDYLDIMTGEAAEGLPEHAIYDQAIDLKEGTTPPWGPVYPLNENELSELRSWLDKQLRNGTIRPSKSPCSSPVIFVPKKEGKGLRLCVDYRGLNKITIANKTPLPLMTELQDRTFGAIWFTKIDLRNGFNLIRIKVGDEWKTAFRTRYGLFETLVMPFGVINGPSSFQSMINHIFRDMLDQGLIAFIDDLLIYAKTRQEHDRIVLEVLRRLRKNRLWVAADKCVWAANQVEFLGYIISKDGISMAEDKVKTILEWETPKSLRDV